MAGYGVSLFLAYRPTGYVRFHDSSALLVARASHSALCLVATLQTDAPTSVNARDELSLQSQQLGAAVMSVFVFRIKFPADARGDDTVR